MSSTILKDQVRELLQEGRLEEVAELAQRKRRTLGTLIALTFDPELLIVWRAIEAMGLSAEALATRNRAFVQEHMRRLYWLITEESGGVFWRAPECMAECAARLPTLFKSHVSIAFHLLETLEEEDLEHFRPGALWAIGRLVSLVEKDLPAVLPLVEEALERKESQVRGMAVWCLGQGGKGDMLKRRDDLMEDSGPVHLYQDREIVETTVGRLAREVLAGATH